MYVFERLDLYNSAVSFSAVLNFHLESFPPSTGHFKHRIATSGAAVHKSIAEAHRFRSTERKDHLYHARAATQECAGFLEIACKQGLMSPNQKAQFQVTLDSLARQLQEMIHSVVSTPTEPPIPIAVV